MSKYELFLIATMIENHRPEEAGISDRGSEVERDWSAGPTGAGGAQGLTDYQ